MFWIINCTRCKVQTSKSRQIFTDSVLVNKSKTCTEFPNFYWYYGSTCFGHPFRPSARVLSRTSTLVHFMQLWWPFVTRSRMELQLHPAPGSKRSSQLHKMYQSRCTAKNSWWWAERMPETCRAVIPIKIGIRCICRSYSQGVCYDARSYDLKIHKHCPEMGGL